MTRMLAVILAGVLLTAALRGLQLHFGLVGLRVSTTSVGFITAGEWPGQKNLFIAGQAVYPWPGQTILACGPHASTAYQIYQQGGAIHVVWRRIIWFPWRW